MFGTYRVRGVCSLSQGRQTRVGSYEGRSVLEVMLNGHVMCHDRASYKRSVSEQNYCP